VREVASIETSTEREIWNMESKTTKKLCCLCRCEIDGYGASPAPLKGSGRCCERCDDLKVLPARLVEYYGFSEATAREIGKAHWNATRTFSGLKAEEWKEYIEIRAADEAAKTEGKK